MPNISGCSLTPSGLLIPSEGITRDMLVDEARAITNIGPGQLYATATTVAAVTETFYIVRGANGTVRSVTAAITGAIATGNDRTVDVDIKKSTGGGSFSTILSAAIQFDDSSVLRTAQNATISSPAVVAGDILQVVITVAGSNLAQATGLTVSVLISEESAS